MAERKKTVRLRATGKLNDANGRVILKGEEFDASEEDADALCNHGLGGLGLATRVVDTSAREEKARYTRRDLRAEE